MTTWGVYGISGRTADNATVAENHRDARRWFVRWRVDGVLKKRTFPTKGYARTFHDQLMRAKLMGWPADDRGWPIDPTTIAPAPTAPPTIARLGPTFADYCTQVWWPIVGPTLGDKNMLGHRNNMLLAIELLVYRDGDARIRNGQCRAGDSIYLSDLVADDLRMAIVARRSINRRTAKVNERRLAAALNSGEAAIELHPEVASPATVRSFYVTLSMIIKAAARSGHLTGDPLNGVADLAPAAKTARITDRMVPSIDEVFDLADAIATLGPVRDGRPLGERYRSLVLVAGTLGPRPGELVAHQPEWIHFGHPTVVDFGATEAAVYDRATALRGSRTRQLKHREPGDFRRVPALDDVTAALREHLDRGYHSTDRTWLSPHGGGHLNWGNIRNSYWRPACERVFTGSSKPELVRMSPKMLRKAAITFWLDAGISPYLASEWAGHSEDVARRYYAGRASDSYASEISRLSVRLKG